MAIKLNKKLVEIHRRRMGIKPFDMARQLGYTTRQGYWDMLNRESLRKLSQISKILSIDERSLVVFK